MTGSLHISKGESYTLKGAAIFFIVLHNVVHLLCPIKENETTFDKENAIRFFNDFFDSPITYFISFFGWMGVSVFVFISAYGLSAKYSNKKINPFNYIRDHYKKLCLLLMPALLIFLLSSDGIIENPVSAIKHYVAEQLLVLNLIRPTEIWPLIYWYVGMAFQLYLLFLIFRNLSTGILLLTGIVCSLILSFSPTALLEYFRLNSIGWIPEFIFGMIYYRFREVKFGPSLIAGMSVFSLLMIVALSASRFTFFLGGIFFVIFMLTVRKWLSKLKIFEWLGVISASIYVTHAIVRYFWMKYLPFTDEQSPLFIALLILVMSIVLAIPYSRYYNKINGSRFCLLKKKY